MSESWMRQTWASWVEVDPAELARYRAKQKQTHNRYIQKRQAMMNRDAVMRRTFLFV